MTGNGKITFNRDEKFDLQLSQALQDERRLGDIFEGGKLDRLELKSEQWLWEQTGCIAIEYQRNGKASGIAATEADMWVHELKRDGKTLLYLMVPMDRLKQLCRDAYRADHYRHGGDDGLSAMVLLRLTDLLK